ncbi:MAG: hypothetical protein JZD41_06385, partial [Thermoproteus sp.]|nr:hypothetical protein [Thermoproteus sp.]
MYQESHVLLNKARATARGLIAEMAYMALVGTTLVPPFGILRRPLVKLISPEILSALALRLAGDDRTISLNSSLG